MKFIITILVAFFSVAGYSQEININPCAIFKTAMINNSTDTLDYYLAMDDSKLSKKDRINIMTFKGAVLIRKNKSRLRYGRNPQPSLIDSSYQLFTDAINMVEDENEKVGYKYRRYETLKEYKPSYTTLNEDKAHIESNGFKEEDFGLEIQLATKYDNDFWIGVEASLIGGLQSPFHFRDDNGKTVKRNKQGKSMSLFTFSHMRNLNSNASESKLSLLKVEAPLLTNITQIGFVKQDGKSYWFYRPEIGVGYGRFSLSYGINIFFKKESKDIIPRHSLNFRTKYVF